MLSPALLEALRTYWRGLRHKPSEWLFPGNRWHTSSHPITTKVLWLACQQAALRAGLEHKHVHPHTLRHCFERHLLEAGADLRRALSRLTLSGQLLSGAKFGKA